MKRAITLLLVLVLAFSLIGCGKSQAVKDAEEAIKAIGTVSLDSKDVIERAEKLYGILTDSEKSNVEGRLALVEAREEYDKLKKTEEEAKAEANKKIIYENAKEAYNALNDVAKMCSNGMDDIYGAWYFGIMKASKASSSSFYSDFASETPHITRTELESAASSLGGKDTLRRLIQSDWNMAVLLAEYVISDRGDYGTIESKMSEAMSILQELTGTYDDYEYYPKLKDYYAKVSSYVEFFKAPTGSFQQLKDTINDYENNIRTYQTDVGFLFK